MTAKLLRLVLQKWIAFLFGTSQHCDSFCDHCCYLIAFSQRLRSAFVVRRGMATHVCSTEQVFLLSSCTHSNSTTGPFCTCHVEHKHFAHADTVQGLCCLQTINAFNFEIKLSRGIFISNEVVYLEDSWYSRRMKCLFSV